MRHFRCCELRLNIDRFTIERSADLASTSQRLPRLSLGARLDPEVQQTRLICVDTLCLRDHLGADRVVDNPANPSSHRIPVLPQRDAFLLPLVSVSRSYQ